MRLVLAAIAASTLAGPALAQTCVIPRDIRAPVASPPLAREIVRDAPTASYMLALTWSPQYCAGRQDARSAQVQCRDNRFGFVLHGLWPNGAGSRHPRYCAPAQALQVSTVRKHLCMTPSADLLQHEWAAHGVCGWRTPEAYFKQAAELWGGLHKPSLSFANGRATTAGEIRRAFVAANPQLRRDGLYVKIAKGGGLEDVRVCYDLRFRPTACRGGLGAPDRATVKVRSARL